MKKDQSAYVELLGKWLAHARSFAPKSSRLTLRQRASVALLQVCRDHCLAIFILLKAGDGHVNASALALLRSALEACMRGGWLGKHLTEVGFGQFQTNLKDKFPSKITCLNALKAHIHPQTFDSLHVHMEAVKSDYHDFAHGGHQQILRKFDSNGSIGHVGTELEVRFIVPKVLLYDLVASQWIAEIMSDDSVKQALLKLVQELDALAVLQSHEVNANSRKA